jgi:hypothetical protein
VAQALGFTLAGVGFAVRAAMMFLGRQQDLRAGVTVPPEQGYNYQRRHERIEDSPHLGYMIHDFQVGIADFLDTV